MTIAFSRIDGDSAEDVPVAAFRTPFGWITAQHATGMTIPVPALASTLADMTKGMPDTGVIAMALPFGPHDPAVLWRAEKPVATIPVATGRVLPQFRPVADEGPAYVKAVTHALARLQADAARPDGLRKVVLARSLDLLSDQAPDLIAILLRLARDPAAMPFLIRLPDQPDRFSPRYLIGASPELLLSKTRDHVQSHPLAGSAQRHPDTATDKARADALRRSDKDKREHALVVEAIMDRLAPWCHALAAPEGTTLHATQTMWHLGTRIEGRLKDSDVPAALIAADLQPTPAVCGTPREAAAQLIAELEPRPRGHYAGAVGWTKGNGDGAFYVALRCAEVSGNALRLFAGAGIVPGSDPHGERAETGAKFATFLNALGLASTLAE